MFVTGWDGLVGRELRRRLAVRPWGVDGGDLPGLDVTSGEALRRRVARFRPDRVVHLAAWTDVDACESDPARAFRANAEGARHAARAAAACGAALLHVSTDYVFGRGEGRPLREDDPVAPLSVYGRSKAAGEHAVRGALPPGRWTILRAQSLYGAGRKSFPDAILAAARRKPRLEVVTDQRVSPTWARDLAGAIELALLRGLAGTFHFSAAGSCTWNEFARAVLDEAGVRDVEVAATTAAALARPAPRPAWSVFDTGRWERATGLRPRPWREMLREYLHDGGRAA